ncbi:uncharacterized protein LOC129777212 [Toxorhynchites rutilus septentrionalis]|uniref:uncharacterized protein LOC129777212 n=1 Tax=Toxorhynchites rutilus septentrionalis TaxID=329112 RepID=UPI002478B53B|nr:uncharacterized protein LOC129777212 [Toxorhynchites rutilus septentrionalis]
MRIGLIVISSLVLLMLVSGSIIKCTKCKKNECECKRKVLKASTVPPDSCLKKNKSADLPPIKDICSCSTVAKVRPAQPQNEVPKFACSTSCECGLQEPLPKKYSADAVSHHLAVLAAKRKHICEMDIHFQGNAAKPTPKSKCVMDVGEERLHKFNRQLIELKPPKKKRVYKHHSTEEDEECPCQVEKQSYAEICYGKVETEKPEFEKITSQTSCSCEVCRDNFSKEFSFEVSQEHKCSQEKVKTEKPPCSTKKPCKKPKISKQSEQQEKDDDDRSIVFESEEEELVRRKRGQHKKKNRKSRQARIIETSPVNYRDARNKTGASML